MVRPAPGLRVDARGGDGREELQGSRRSNVLVALRSLLGCDDASSVIDEISCKKRKSIFRSPVQGVRVGEYPHGVIQPLSQDEVDRAASAAITPEARLGLVLAAMHAARVKAIRELHLDDVDLGNRRITIGGRTRPLDDLTREVLLEWLAHRAARWPSTANPYLLVNHRSATAPAPSAPATSPRQHCGGPPSPWKDSVSTGSSSKRSPSARPAAPGLGVRPRPQDSDPLRGERPAVARHRRRRASSRRHLRRRMSDSPLQDALRAGADGLYAPEAGTGLVIAHGCWTERRA